VKTFQSAIITEPGTSKIYNNEVPVEIFLHDTIDRIDILLEGNSIYNEQIVNTYLNDTLIFEVQDMKDAILVFNCYDKENNLIKSEEKNILISPFEVTLPTIQISTNNDFWQTGSVEVNYQIDKTGDFTIGSKLDYIYYPHVGFGYGQKFQITMPGGEQVNLSRQHIINANVEVFTLGAGFEVNYNSFQKRIVNQVTYSKADDVTGGNHEYFFSTPSIHVYPNPTTDIIKVGSDIRGRLPSFDYIIYNSTGVAVKQGKSITWDQAIDIHTLNKGIYYIRVFNNRHSDLLSKKVLKF